ncbi:MAG: TonB-dependent receptor plug domain-containing protein, partial [Fermentimonas sp.]|nr:TonB-dependent receptor plug domain-containing protein [Fermentimonas sp.]
MKSKLLLLPLLLWMFAITANPQVTVNVTNKSVRETLKEIERKSEYKFFFNESLAGLEKQTSLNVNDADIAKVMSMLLAGTGIDYRVEENNLIVLVTKSVPATRLTASQQTNRTITGTITDPSGEPIIGATIVLKDDPATGTVTDFDGNFALQVTGNPVLQVSYIGYTTQEVATQGLSTLNIILSEDTQQLDELVVVGYMVQRKESLTGSMQSISSDKLKDITTPSVENMLNSKAPGVYVAPGSGQPGSAGSIVIRGKSTVNGSTDPLWVIDGVIVGSSAGSLNPSDIESMTILKDAASTAIYGSQGANGVIVVTTKNPSA